MENHTIAEWIKINPHLSSLANKQLIVQKETYDQYQSGPVINNISVALLNDIITKSDYLIYLSKFFDNQFDYFTLGYFMNGDVAGNMRISRVALINALEEAISKNAIDSNPNTLEMIEKYKSNLSFSKLREKYDSSILKLNIDNVNYSFPIKEIIDLFMLSNEEFIRICQDPNIRTIGNYPKEVFIYAAFVFIKQDKILGNYILDPIFRRKNDLIGSLQLIDIQAINKITVTDDPNIKNLHINPELKKAIFEGMSDSLSQIEKAIYIYVKMCKILSYDDKFYAVNQQGPIALEHENFDFFSNITPSNNRVVCYEFNAMYGMLLNELGINFETKQMKISGFGGHASLKFRCGKYLVFADSVTTILNGDLINMKINYGLNGLKCENTNDQTQKEFNEYLLRIQKEVAQCDEIHNNIQSFQDVINRYSEISGNIKFIGLEKRLEIMMEKAKSLNLQGLDFVAYIRILKTIFFDNQQGRNNIQMSIIKKNIESTMALEVVMALNEFNYQTDGERNKYYIIDPEDGITMVTLNDLQNKFDIGEYEYIAPDKPKIPGLVEKGVSK